MRNGVITISLVLVAMLTLLIPSKTYAQPTAIPTQKFAFDYGINDYTTYSITHFEQQLDGAGWLLITPATQNDSLTPSGMNTHVVAIPPMSPGNHRVEFRACNIAGCSAPLALDFRLVVVPPAATGARIVLK